MPTRLAYHLVVRAMEARAGVTPAQQLVAALQSVVHGHLDYNRYVAAGEHRARQGAGAESVARDLRELFQTDLNPAVRGACGLSSPSAVAFAYNSYNQSAHIAVKTEISLKPGTGAGDHGSGVSTRRTLVQSTVDLALCRTATLLVFDELQSQAVSHRSAQHRPGMKRVADVAAILGVEGSPVAQLAALFETQGFMPIGDAARALGCHQRTLERQLKREGTTAEGIRMATRILRAHQRFTGTENLTTIAHDEGFSDLAHMTRSFRASCGMTPTLLRRVLQAGKAATA